jgi:hypothetical protein
MKGMHGNTLASSTSGGQCSWEVQFLPTHLAVKQSTFNRRIHMYGEWTRTDKNNLSTLPNGTAFSYETIILQVLDDGSTIGNVTRYSNTTSRHQSKVGARTADVLVTDIPEGSYNLVPFTWDAKHVVAKESK